MDLGIMLSEITQRERQILYIFTFMWNPKNKAHEQIEQKQMHRYREQTSVYQRGKGWEEGQNS